MDPFLTHLLDKELPPHLLFPNLPQLKCNCLYSNSYCAPAIYEAQWQVLEITALSLRCLSDIQVEGEATADTELEVKNKKEVGSYLCIDGSES